MYIYIYIYINLSSQMDGFPMNSVITILPLGGGIGLRAEDTVQREEPI